MIRRPTWEDETLPGLVGVRVVVFVAARACSVLRRFACARARVASLRGAARRGGDRPRGARDRQCR
eukprot:6175417-Pleurochrysis_carterae.AAC.1